LKLQKSHVISSGSETYGDHSDQDFHFDSIKKTDPLQKIFLLGQVNNCLLDYCDKKPLTNLDKRLLKGFYVTNEQELDNNERQGKLHKDGNKTALEEIMQNYFLAKTRDKVKTVNFTMNTVSYHNSVVNANDTAQRF